MPSRRDSILFRELFELRHGQPDLHDVSAACRSYLRAAQRIFVADAACLAIRGRDGGIAHPLEFANGSPSWNDTLLTSLLDNRRTELPGTLIIAKVYRRERLWGVFALGRDVEAFEPGDGKSLAKLTQALSGRLAELDDRRARSVQERIDRKVLERLRPQDVFYRILHGIRSLTDYDHSSALLTRASADEFEIVAEQAAWTKTKSARVGRRIAATADMLNTLHRGQTLGYDRRDTGWAAWGDAAGADLAQALAFDGDGAPPERAILCAPLISRDRVVGVLKVAARTPDRLGPYEAELLRRFQLHAAVAIDNLRETEELRRDVIRAERKNAMATIARGISHDVNNALGQILPLVQQLRAELEDGDFDPNRANTDLQHIENAMHLCRRVFAGLVQFAKSGDRQRGTADLRRAVANALSIVQGSVRRQGIDVALDLPAALPMVRSLQHEMEQLLLNLAANACDAMPHGGRLAIAAHVDGDHIAIHVGDTGQGMTREQLARCSEAFYSTKSRGNGLGLAICQSIVKDARGRITIDSEVDVGTTIRLRLPIASTSNSREEAVG